MILYKSIISSNEQHVTQSATSKMQCVKYGVMNPRHDLPTQLRQCLPQIKAKQYQHNQISTQKQNMVLLLKNAMCKVWGNEPETWFIYSMQQWLPQVKAKQYQHNQISTQQKQNMMFATSKMQCVKYDVMTPRHDLPTQ